MKRALCAAILTFEAIVLGLTTPVLISVQDVGVAKGLWIGLGLTVLCVLTAGMLRREWAYWLGWLVQVAAIALGFEIHAMFFLGVIFFALWLTAFLLGVRIDADRAAAEAAVVHEEAEPVVAPDRWDHELACTEDTHKPFVREALQVVLTPLNLALVGLAVLSGVALLFSEVARPVGVLLVAAAVGFPAVTWAVQRQAWHSFLAPGRVFRTAFEADRLVVQADDHLASIEYDDVVGVTRDKGLVTVDAGERGTLQLPESVFPDARVREISARR